MATTSQTTTFSGHKFAFVVGRKKFDEKILGLVTLEGVAPTVRNAAVDFVCNGFKAVVLADTPMALLQPGFKKTVDEDKYARIAKDAIQKQDLLWIEADATRDAIQRSLSELAAMFGGRFPGAQDQVVVYICSHGVLNASDGSYGATLADTRCTALAHTDASGNAVPATYEGTYTMEQLREDLGVDSTRLWRNVLVVLDTCSSADAFDETKVSARVQGTQFSKDMQAFVQNESYQCLAAAPCQSSAFCLNTGTVLHTALRRAWLSPGGDGGAFARDKEGAARWATVGCVADRVNDELAKLMSAEVTNLDEFYEFRQTCLLGRLPWREDVNTGECVVFNGKYTERNKLAMVPAVPASFTGRKDEFRQLETRPQQSGTAAIGNLAVSAAGGVGKSTLAAEYARRNAHEYHSVIWVHGTSATTMMGSYREAVRYIPLKHVDAVNAKEEEVVAAVKEWLLHERGWLMVVDGCDVITDEMKTMIPGGVMEGKMIVTTRLRSVDELGALFGGGYALMELGVFDEKEGMEYMRKRLPKRGGEDEELKTIVEKLGGMPLALDLATAYLAATPHVSAGEYRARIETDRLKALKKRNWGGGLQLEDRVVATYEPSLARAMEIGGKEMVRKMVGVMGFLEGSGMEVEVLRLLLVGQRKKEEADEDAFDVALGALCRLSVVDVNKSAVSMHQLVQDVCRVVAFGDEEEMWSELQRVGRVIEDEVNSDSKVYGDVEWSRRVGVHGTQVMGWACAEVGRRRTRGETEEYSDGVVWLGIRLSDTWRNLGEYALALRPAQSACECVHDKESVLASDALMTLGSVYQQQSDYSRALEVYQQALTIREAKLVNGTEATGNILNNMAIVIKAQGDYSRALEYYERALTIYQKTSFGPSHSSTGGTLNNIGEVYRQQEDYSRALEYYGRALTIYKKSVGPNHPSTGATLSNMAAVFKAQEDYSRALEYYGRALTIYKKSVGPNHPSTGDALNGMAGVFYSNGEYSRALEYYGRALTIKEKSSLGHDHLSTGQTLYNMAAVFKAQGDFSRALEYYERALTIRKNSVGLDHPLVGDTLSDMANLFSTQKEKDYSRALEYYERALTIYEKSPRPDNPSKGNTLNNMASVFEAQGDYSRALEYYERALTIREKSLGPDHPSTGNTLNGMANVFKAQGGYSRALEYYGRALTIREKSPRPDNPSTGDTLDNMAGVFWAQRDYSRALEYYERALTIREKSLGPDHPSTGDTLNGMANAFVVQGDYSRALEYYGRALTIYKKSVGADHPSIGNTLNNMAVVCKLLVPTTHPQAY